MDVRGAKMYVSSPATFEVNPPALVAPPPAAGAGVPALAPTGAPHDPQNAAPSFNVDPHFVQAAMALSPFRLWFALRLHKPEVELESL